MSEPQRPLTRRELRERRRAEEAAGFVAPEVPDAQPTPQQADQEPAAPAQDAAASPRRHGSHASQAAHDAEGSGDAGGSASGASQASAVSESSGASEQPGDAEAPAETSEDEQATRGRAGQEALRRSSSRRSRRRAADPATTGTLYLPRVAAAQETEPTQQPATTASEQKSAEPAEQVKDGPEPSQPTAVEKKPAPKADPKVAEKTDRDVKAEDPAVQPEPPEQPTGTSGLRSRLGQLPAEPDGADDLSSLDERREKAIREAMARRRAEREAGQGSQAARTPSFADVLGLDEDLPPVAPAPQEPPAPKAQPKAEAKQKPQKEPERAPASQHTVDPEAQRALENTGLIAPITQQIRLSPVAPAPQREQAQASPLQARSAHGLDPLEYRASGVRRTRATLTVVACSVIVAIAAVVIAIKL